MISEQALHHLSNPEKYQIRFLDRAIVKGRNEPIAVYEVLNAEVEATRLLKLETQPDFEKGLELYRNCNLKQAKASFEKVLAVNPSDKTAQLYTERVEILLDKGIPENWNGVWAFMEK